MKAISSAPIRKLTPTSTPAQRESPLLRGPAAHWQSIVT